MKSMKLAILSAAVLLSTSAMANVFTDTAHGMVEGGKNLFKTATNPAAVSLEVGTLGYGANIAWATTDKTEVVAGWNGGDISGTLTVKDDSYINWEKVLGDDVDFVGDIKLKADLNNPYLGANFRPWANAFTVGTGVIVNNSKTTLTVDPSDTASFSMNNKEYLVDKDASVDVTIDGRNALAPYLTLGFRPSSHRRFGMFGEIGAAYVGDVRVNAKANANGLTTPIAEVVTPATLTSAPVTTAANVAQFERDLEKELKSNTVSWYPIVKVGATVRF